MITPLLAVLLTVSGVGATTPIVLDAEFDPFANTVKDIMTPLSEESMQIIQEYTDFRNTYPLELALSHDNTSTTLPAISSR